MHKPLVTLAVSDDGIEFKCLCEVECKEKGKT